VDDRRFDALARRAGALTLPHLPRRGLIRLAGGVTLAAVLGHAVAPQTAAARCKKEGDPCNKRQCENDGKKCCCKDLECKNDVCKASGGSCPVDPTYNSQFGGTGTGAGKFRMPWGITVDPDGEVYVTDNDNFRVQIFNQNGGFEDEFGSQGSGKSQFRDPLGIAFNKGNDRLFVSDPDQNPDRRLRRFRPDGTGSLDLGGNGEGNPAGIAVDKNKNVWVVDASGTGKIFLYNSSGEFERSFSPTGQGQLQNPEGIAVYRDKNADATYVFVADTGNDRLVKFELVGSALEFVRKKGSFGTENSRFISPTGLAVDKCGNVWVADRGNDRVQVFDKNFKHLVSFGSSGSTDGKFQNPTGVALTPDGDFLYVVDSDNDRVQKLALS
jgi:DNA-binding beta-propeller fold protein YncE